MAGRPIFLLVAEAHGWGFAAIYCITTVFMTFGLFNVIVAIYVENTVEAARFNEVRLKQNRLVDQQMFKEKTAQLVEMIWKHHDSNTDDTGIGSLQLNDLSQVAVTQAKFEMLLQDKRFQDILKDLDIPEEEQVDLFDTLDVDGGGTLDLEEFVHGIGKLRGDARRSDVVSVGLMVRALMESIGQFENLATQQLKFHADSLIRLQALVQAQPRDHVALGLPETTTRESMAKTSSSERGSEFSLGMVHAPSSRRGLERDSVRATISVLEEKEEEEQRMEEASAPARRPGGGRTAFPKIILE